MYKPFEQITGLTDVAEGTIVRVITRLDETCREVRDAARVIGDAELFKKMEESQIKIKRDSELCLLLTFPQLTPAKSCICSQSVLLNVFSIFYKSREDKLNASSGFCLEQSWGHLTLRFPYAPLD